MNEDYRQGFEDGFTAGIEQAQKVSIYFPHPDDFVEGKRQARGRAMRYADEKPKRKVKQTPKQKLLTKMAAAKWNKYKKGRGKKTYVEIRGEVSRSQAFKKKAKRL